MEFRGISKINLDAKGRMSIPARYRDQIEECCGGQVVVTADPDYPCLLLYPLLAWKPIQQQVAALPSFNPRARHIQRMMIGCATDIELDASSRLLLSSELREHAKMDKTIFLLGQESKFEIWSEELWSETSKAYLEQENLGADDPEILKILSL